jgi:putative ABC transport system permease protein
MQRIFGISGLLAAQRLSQNPRRIAASGSVLLIGAWAAVVVSSTNFGFRAFADEWQASENVWDVTIAGPGSSPFRPALSLPTSMLEKIVHRSDVLGVAAERLKTIETASGEIDLRAIDIAAFRAQGARFLWNKGDETAAYARLIDPLRPAVLLSSFASFSTNVQPGEMITVETPRGAQSFEVVGTILGAIDPVGLGKASLIIDRDLYRRLWQDNRVDRLLIRLQPGTDVAAVRRDLQHAYAAGGFIINSPADLTAAFSQSISSMTVVSQVLSIMLLATLILGVANTLIIDALDRRRELGLWRALGLRGRQATASVVIEVALVAILISALAVPMGMYNNYANTLSMGEIFAIRFVLSPDEVAVSLALLCGAAVCASYWPARQAGRVDVLAALRDE